MPLTTYQQFYAQYDVAIRSGADEATAAGLRWVAGVFPAIIIPVIIVAGLLLAWGLLDKGRIFQYGGRAAIVIYLVISQAFVPIVRDNIIDGVPNEIASAINGNGSRITAVEQFDRLDQASGYFTARVLGQATGISQIGNKIAAWAARGFQKFFLEATFVIWMGVRMLTHIAVALLAFSLVFLLMQSTSQWVMEQLGKIIGLLSWQIAMSILLKVMLTGTEVFLRETLVRGQGMSIEQQVDVCFDIAGWFFACFVLVLMVPSIIGVGAGAATSSLIASGAMVNAGRMFVNAANKMGRAAHAMRRRR
jgi:hypothetical protein